MIETTYIRLKQAAKILSTDDDTLLIAAAEGRVRAYWLLNRAMEAERGSYEESDYGPEGPPDVWVPVESTIRHFMFIPLDRSEAAELLKRSVVEVTASWLSLPTEDQTQWRSVGGWGAFQRPDEELQVTRDHVYLERADVEVMRTKGAARADTIDLPNQRINDRLPRSRDNSLITTIAALLATWPSGAVPSGKDLEKAAQSLGLSLSDDTIRKILKAAREAAPSLPLPK